jgi:DNA-binding NarL/FixJ family response regulator
MSHNLHNLPKRQREITILVADGAGNKEIARQLTISEKTVRNILTRVLAKTGARSRTELAVQWVQAKTSFASE